MSQWLRKNMNNDHRFFDEETGVYRSKLFSHLVEREVRRALRYQEFLVVLALDLGDQLRQLPNAREVQRLAAEQILREVRTTDIVGRLGEQLAIALICIAVEDARLVAERLQARVRAVTPPRHPSSDGPAAVSVGGACFPRSGTDAAALLQGSLTALRRAAAEPGGGVWIQA
ncbi:MAG TPA: diguanylate cyclase [Candidatus Acidoferrum sp.]|nr:diguanylate cyclase [Candidatus Acidoferrum sp.]